MMVMTLSKADSQETAPSQNNNPENSPNSEEFTSSSTQRDVRARKVVHRRLREHGVVFQLRFAQWRAVTSDQHKLG